MVAADDRGEDLDNHAGRRRIDRITAADFTADLGSRTIADLRAMRDTCREEEASLSYARRLLHGQLDVARAEHARRGEPGDLSLVDTLARILSDSPGAAGGPRSASNASVYVPPEGPRRRERDQLLAAMVLAELPDLGDGELDRLIERLQSEEHAVSTERRAVLDVIDVIQEELIGRFKAGAGLDEIMVAATQPRE